MASIVIRLNGVDITGDVIFADARFISMANGNTGTCAFRVRDLVHEYHTIRIGDEITLDIDGQRQWGGFVLKLERGYFFEARDCRCPSTVPLYYQVIGSDYNILLHKRILYDPADPTNMELQAFPPDTPDDQIVEFYTQNYLDLSGDGIDLTSLVDHVGSPSFDETISGPAGITWNAFMIFAAYNSGAIWYIDPDKKLVYTDVDTPNAPFEISDQPSEGQVGVREMTIWSDGTRLVNDALVWGAGKGSDELVLGRTTDAASINQHGLWQVGRVVGGAWRQATVDRTAATYVDGAPGSQRGGKIDRTSVDCVLFTPGLRVAQKVSVHSEVFAFTDVIPIRVMQMTFPTSDSVRYQLTLAHEVDEPQTLTDPVPRIDRDEICSLIHCGPYQDETWSGAITTASGTWAGGLTGYGTQWGSNGWFVFVDGLNYWQWTTNPAARSGSTTSGAQAYVDLQWADLYQYTHLPGVLVERGEPGWVFGTGWGLRVTPNANAISGQTHTQWTGIATVTVRVTGNSKARPRKASRPVFPFTSWQTDPLVPNQVVSFGCFNAIDIEPENQYWPPLTPDRVITTEGTFQLRQEGIYVLGERWSASVPPDNIERTYTVGVGTFPASTPVRTYFRLKEVDFGNAAGTVRLHASVQWEWRPAAEGGIITPRPIDEDCEPRCITIGENCEIAERIGGRSFRVFGAYASGSTRVTIDGVARHLGVDYLESNPSRGEITFTFDVAVHAVVYVCYDAYAIADQIPSITATNSTLSFPLSGPITGQFGPQGSLWPSLVWHGIYYDHFHNGVDFGVASGTPVFASARGVVEWEDQEAGGTMIHIYHDAPDTPIPMRTTYAHLSARSVGSGTIVEQGEHIGYSGASGIVTGAHLHWQLSYYGWPEDPIPWTAPIVEEPPSDPVM